MAEAFGIAAGVLQVAGFGAEVSRTLWQCAKKIRNAEKDLEVIVGLVSATANCLDGVGQLLKDPETKAQHTSKLYEDTRAVSSGCQDIFNEIQDAVKTYERKVEGGKNRLPMLARVRWPLDSRRLEELQRVLKHYKDVLLLMLSVLQIVEGRRAAYVLSRIAFRIRR